VDSRSRSRRIALDARAHKLAEDLGLEIAALFAELTAFSADHGAPDTANLIFESALTEIAAVIGEYRKVEIES
jgi:hypothetical protein